MIYVTKKLVKKTERTDGLNKPVLLRKWCRPHFPTLQFVSRHEEKSDAVEPYYPNLVKEHFEVINYKTIDAVHNVLKERFEQPSFIIFSNVEQLLLKSINGESYQKEYDNFVSVYANDVKRTALPSELLFFRTMFESLELVYFGAIKEKLKTKSPQDVSSLIT